MMYRFLTILLLIVAIFGCLCISDCCYAPVQWKSGVVIDKIYHQPWIELETDAKGRISTTYHDADYYLVCRVGDSTGRVNVQLWTYDSFTFNDEVMVQFRTGMIMHYNYLAVKRP